MIFIVTEHIMNGSVTMDTMVTGVEADNFDAAVEKLKAHPEVSRAKIIVNSEDDFQYRIAGEFPVWGRITDNPLTMLKVCV